MLHKLLLLLCLGWATTAGAQKTPANRTKNTQKQDDSKYDYQRPGARMPDLLFEVRTDTTRATVKDALSRKEDGKAKKVKRPPFRPGQMITQKDLVNNANLLIMTFNPGCSHCEETTIELEHNIGAFKKSKLVLVANSRTRTRLHDFVSMLHLNEYPEIIPCIDSMGYVDKTYNYQTLPQINVYDHKRILIKTFSGDVPIDSLKKYIE